MGDEAKPFRQSVTFTPFKENVLLDELRLQEQRLSPKGALRQLQYLQDTVAKRLGCRSIATEAHYVDRDYMEDHSVFYSRSLYPYRNTCRRVHFFSESVSDVRKALTQLRELAVGAHDKYVAACREFSTRAYLGFSVIKPLEGCPVGRTILVAHRGEAADPARYAWCTRPYTAHFWGTELHVRGLPFQQQDKAVAACATTAVWSALQVARGLEDIGQATPAQITMRAAQNSLPFGRAMPSEGLSIDQMCQAIQATGVSPVLRRGETFEHARALLYSAAFSEVAPVVITKIGKADRHAIVVAGIKLRTRAPRESAGIVDRAAMLDTVYVHDDRYGPYIPTSLVNRGGHLWLKNSTIGLLEVTHLLIPMHAKVRNAFGELRLVAEKIANLTLSYREVIQHTKTPLYRDYWIERGHRYVHTLASIDKVAAGVRAKLVDCVALPRYVGVVRMSSKEDLDPVDVLIDTTSTDRNIHVAAVVMTANSKSNTLDLASHLAAKCSCKLVTP